MWEKVIVWQPRGLSQAGSLPIFKCVGVWRENVGRGMEVWGKVIFRQPKVRDNHLIIFGNPTPACQHVIMLTIMTCV